MPRKTFKSRTRKRPSLDQPSFLQPERDPSTVKAALITRLSEWVDGTSSVDRQRADGAAYITARGWQYDPEQDLFEDIDISGWKDVHRPGLEALLERLADYDVVVFWKLDRVFRSVFRFLAFLDECEQVDTGLVSVQEPFLDTTNPMGRMVAVLLMAIAEMESVNTSLRVHKAWEGYAGAGRWLTAPPYGWAVSRDDTGRSTCLVLDPIRSVVVKGIVERYLAGDSTGAIAKDLNTAQVPTARGGVWDENRITKMLTNPVLVGQHRYKGRLVVDAEGVPIAPHEALLDFATWTRLQEKVQGRKWGRERVRHDERLLRGLVRCAGCGNVMSAGGTPDTTRSNYRCVKTHRSTCERSNAISQRHLDAFVATWLFGYMTDEILVQAAAVREEERQMYGRPGPEQEKRQRLTQQLDRLEEDRREGLYDSEVATARYRAQHKNLTDHLAALAPAPRPALSVLAGLPDISGPLAKAWPNLERGLQRQILFTLVERIDIAHRAEEPGPWRFDPARVTIVPRFRASVPSVPTETPELQEAS